MPVSHHLRARAGLLAVSGSALLWGTTGVAVRIVNERSGLSAVPIGCYRLIIAALALALVLRRPGLRRARAAFRRQGGSLVLAGAGLGVYQALYFVGVQNVGVSVSTLISLAVAPVTITAGTAITRRRLPDAGSFVIMVLAIGGLALVSLTTQATSTQAPHPLLGILASLGSGFGYAATTVLNSRLAADGEPLVLTWITCVVGAIVLVPIAVPMGMAWPTDGIATGWMIYIGLVPTVFAYLLFYAGLRSVRPEVAGVLTLLEPLTAAVLAALCLHESLSTLGLCGAALLLVAVGGLYARGADREVTVR